MAYSALQSSPLKFQATQLLNCPLFLILWVWSGRHDIHRRHDHTKWPLLQPVLHWSSMWWCGTRNTSVTSSYRFPKQQHRALSFQHRFHYGISQNRWVKRFTTKWPPCFKVFLKNSWSFSPLTFYGELKHSISAQQSLFINNYMTFSISWPIKYSGSVLYVTQQ